MHGVVAIAGFVLGGLFCAVLAVAEWGAWMLVAPGRRLKVGDTGGSPGMGEHASEPIEAWTDDGLRLAGVWYPSPSSTAPGRTAIVIHGFAEDPRGFRDRAQALADRGWNAAAIDLRGHGQSEGEHTSFGGRESDDLHAWIAVLAARVGPGMTLAVWGRSMGRGRRPPRGRRGSRAADRCAGARGALSRPGSGDRGNDSPLPAPLARASSPGSLPGGPRRSPASR